MQKYKYADISLCGISRRMDYERNYRIKYEKQQFLISKNGKEFLLLNPYEILEPVLYDIISVMSGSLFIPIQLPNIYNIIAKFVFCTHSVMVHNLCWYGPAKSNWHACLVKYPKALGKGKCYLSMPDQKTTRVVNKNEVQKFTYYMLPKWWGSYFE